MAPPESRRDFYGAIIREAKVGPRHELSLRLETWRQEKHTFGGGVFVNLRFGAINNFDDVKKFFHRLPNDGLHYLREGRESKVDRRVIEIEFDRTESRINIIARKVTMTVSNPVADDHLGMYCHQCQKNVTWPASITTADKSRFAAFVHTDAILEGMRFAKESCGMELDQAKGLLYHITRKRRECHRCKQKLAEEISTCASCHSLNLDW